ncbi:hypothetical protein RTP6_003923 [Batrachochytrium dendrobatidis]
MKTLLICPSCSKMTLLLLLLFSMLSTLLGVDAKIVWWQPDDTSPYLLRCYGFRIPAPVCVDNNFALNHIKAGEPLTLTVSRDDRATPASITVLLKEYQGSKVFEYPNLPLHLDASRPSFAVAVFTPASSISPGGYHIIIKSMTLPLNIWIDSPSANWTLSAPTLKQLEETRQKEAAQGQIGSTVTAGDQVKQAATSLPGIAVVSVVLIGAISALVWTFLGQIKNLIRKWTLNDSGKAGQYERFRTDEDDDIIEMNTTSEA